MRRIIPLLLMAALFAACGNKVEITNLTVEMQDGSMPLATATPRFSWNYEATVDNVMQTSYHIIVASSEEKARRGEGDLWDSQTVDTSQMLYIPYAGTPLKSRDRCWWRVYTTVTYGAPASRRHEETLESSIQYFELSLLDSSDWHARWIGRDYPDDKIEGHTEVPARYLRHEFQLRKDIDHARLYISGLGQYQAFFNGQEVAPDELLKPALSDYTRRVYFNAYDVTDLLWEGDNAVGVILAPGRFTTPRHDTNYLEWCGINHAAHYGRPQLLMQLEVFYKDGTADTIVSGEGWRITNRGPIRKANEFDGETFDQHLDVALGAWLHTDYDDSQWQDAVVDYDRQNMNLEDRFNPRWKRRDDKYDASMPFPDSAEIAAQRLEYELTPQPNPNIHVMEHLTPKAIFRKGDKWILDMGQNMVGVLQVNNISSLLVKKDDGTGNDTITFRYAELLAADSTLYTDNLRSAECTDRYIAFAKYELPWHPQFVYHGFRYVEISGLPEGSKPSLNDFTGLVLYDQMASTSTFETDNDIINAVHRNAFWGIRGNYRSMPTDCPQRDERMGWTGDRTTGCYGESFQLHRQHDMARRLHHRGRHALHPLRRPGACPHSLRCNETLAATHEEILPQGRHPHPRHLRRLVCAARKSRTDTHPRHQPYDLARQPLHAVLLYCKLMKGFAAKIGNYADTAYFENEMDFVRSAYNARYLDTLHGCYSNNTVTANLLPLAFGMVPEELEDKVFANIIDKTLDDFGGHVSTGVVGIQQLMTTLTEHGRGDLALRIATDTTYPSWGYMVKHGATTIWELWNGDTGDPSMNSGNHVMLLGDLIPWYYSYLGGIRGFNDYSRIILKPYLLEGLRRVTCSYNSVSGRIESNWRRKGDVFEWDILIPPNRTAEVWLPTADGYELLKLGSGRHHFTI